MSREIKFRAWDKITQSMISWSELTSVKNNLKLSVLKGVTSLKWMQFTGLKDNNGVDIYEGDLLEFPQFNAGVVKIETSGVCAVGFECFISNKSFHICKVIGNIHENKN